MVEPEVLAYLFQMNLNTIHRECVGLTHEDSLLQLPFRGNCLNWVLGHLVESRAELMELIGIELIWPKTRWHLYEQGSEPITEANRDLAYPLDSLLADLDKSQEQIIGWLQTKTLADMNQPSSDQPNRTWGRRIAFFAWHEAFHVGQTEQLRQLAGKNDQVIE
ncbi:MAG TPA: DinB family protein [Phototrophicaceae bacterium]|nr:DinB family protein [Phototrophicaceae bacterium]